MKLPKTISPCPIIEAVVEIRFDSDMDTESIIGKLYNFFSTNSSVVKFEKLPILQLPDTFLSSDPNLKFQPYYRIAVDNFVFQFGPKVMSLSNTGNYVGWDAFNSKLVDIFSKIMELGIIDKVIRFGIRYINYFDAMNIYEKITLETKLNNQILDSKQLVIRAELPLGNFQATLQVASNAQVNIQNEQKVGSVIDIDIFNIDTTYDYSSNLPQLLTTGHKEEKKLFFQLLKTDFLATLNPQYFED